MNAEGTADASNDAPSEVVQVATSFWRRRIVHPILAQLRTGIAPEKIALTVSLGAVLGVFPILGATMFLCGFAAHLLRLNQPIIQMVNYFAYPAQVALLLVFYRAGESLFGKTHVDLSIPMLMARFGQGPWQFLKDFGLIGLQGTVVWLILAPFVAAGLYFILCPSLRVLARRARSRS